MNEEGRLQVLLVEDNPMVRSGIRSMLESYGDIRVVGEASNGIEAIMLMEQLHPSIVLMDINMPKMDGVEATAQIMRGHPNTIIMGLSMNTSTHHHETMIRAGAVRLIPKEQAADVLYDAIHEAVQSRDLSKALRSISTQVREEE